MRFLHPGLLVICNDVKPGRKKRIQPTLKSDKNMLKEIIQSFLPWILYFVLLGQTQQRLELAILVATFTSIAFEFKALKKGFILSWGTLLFFVSMLVAVIIFKNKWIVNYVWILSNSALALIVWISILIRRPFTIQYAKEKVSQDKWHHPLFLKINYLLSAVWGLMFLVGVALNVLRLLNPLFNPWFYEILSYIPSIFAIWFTLWFPDWYKEKYLRENKLL